MSEVARLAGPHVALVIRFARKGEERFARWIGGEDCRARAALDRLFSQSERVGTVERPQLPAPAEPNDDTGVGPAPAQTIALWVKLVATMGPDELADVEERTFRQWDRESLFDLRRAIERRRREFAQ